MSRLACLWLLLPASASADFVTLDRLDASPDVGVEASYVRRVSPFDHMVARLDVHGHWSHPELGVGGYLVAPFKYNSHEDVEFEVQNIELGGFYVRTVAPRWQLVARVGVGLPTGDARYYIDSVGELDPHVIAALARPADMATQFDARTTARAGISAVFDAERLFGRVDLGVDRVFTDDRRTVLRAGAGVGVAVQRVALMGELAILDHSEETDGPYVLGALAARFDLGTVRPYAAVVVPFDDASQRRIDVAITVGADVSIPD